MNSQKFLNQDFELIKPEEYQKASGFCKELISDSLFSAIRGGSIGILAYEFLSQLFLKFLPLVSPWNYVVASAVGSLVFLHSNYVHYQMRRRQNALKLIPLDELERRKIEAVAAKNEKPDTESQSLIENSTKDPLIHKRECFDKIANAQKSRKLEFAIDVVVNSTQLLRLLAFWLFAQSVNQLLLNNSISPINLFALTLLWGAEVFKNDRELYRRALSGTWTGISTRWQLEKHLEESGFVRSSQNFWCNFLKTRTIRVLTKSPYDYEAEVLEEALEETIRKKV